MNGFQTWIRVEDDFGQFDHPKDAPLPKGVRVVRGEDEYIGPFARPGKPRTDKAGEPASSSIYDSYSKADLEDEVAKRNADRDEPDHVAIAPPGNKPDLIAALTADDTK
jgi:hypothetical protein